MYDQKYGRIINTASQLAYKGSAGFAYTAAKGAIISFTRSLSLEIGTVNIRAKLRRTRSNNDENAFRGSNRNIRWN